MPGKSEDTGVGPGVKPAKYQVVAWDLDTTGRRLIDEICQIGGYYRSNTTITEPSDQIENGQDNESIFSQYVMPYRNPNPGARRSFGIRVVNIGRYRMLKDVQTGKVLKTKSEVSALQGFLSWLDRAKGQHDGVILAFHEPQRKVLVPLLLEALHKYNLIATFTDTVKGLCNATDVISALGDHDKITSLSLRSLCKTVLGDTSLPTASATDRSRVLIDILANVTQGQGKLVDCAKIANYINTVETEQLQLKTLKDVIGTQGTLRPIFESLLRQKRLVREKAMNHRRLLAEAHLDYSTLQTAYNSGSLRNKLVATKMEKCDVEEVLILLQNHFSITSTGDDKTDNSSQGLAATVEPTALPNGDL